MKIYCVNSACAAFSAEAGEKLDKDSAAKLVEGLLKEKRLEKWHKTNIDVFAAKNARLYLAYHGEEIKINIADYALPFLSEYFTE